jgi:hypothetical protein
VTWQSLQSELKWRQGLITTNIENKIKTMEINESNQGLSKFYNKLKIT